MHNIKMNLRTYIISWWFMLFMESYAPSLFEETEKTKDLISHEQVWLYSYETKTV